MATFARDTAQHASETFAADAALDAWLAAHALGRESTRAELEALVRDLAACPELWDQHDHDRSRGAVAVVSGALAERRLAVGGPPPTAIHPTGASFSFGATHIHDVSQTGSDLATSLHVYSPRLGEMGFYEVAPDGMLGRRTGDHREEFC
jgi:hypothetical protein